MDMKSRFKLRLIWINELLYSISMLIIIFCLHFFQKRKVYQMLQSVCLWWESSIYQSLVYLVQVTTRYRKERLGSINKGMLPKMQVYIKECNESIKKRTSMYMRSLFKCDLPAWIHKYQELVLHFPTISQKMVLFCTSCYKMQVY